MKNARKYVCKCQTKTSDRFLVTGAAFDVRIFSEKGMCVVNDRNKIWVSFDSHRQ